MIVLGLESSCDDTGVALVDTNRSILANCLSSQLDVHKPYGGVVPEIAARSHLTALEPLIDEAMRKANIGWNDIDCFAATSGPGLIGGVMIGMVAAKTMALLNNKPFIGINHLEGHVLTPRLCFAELQYPFLCLLVSGGHTQLIYVKALGVYELLGSTRDDAAGEAFDKTAKMMGLGYPGGPLMEKLAATCKDPEAALAYMALQPPMQHQKHCDFSFSGLKTAAAQKIAAVKEDPIPQETAASIAYAVQHTIAESLADRTNRALLQLKEEGKPVTALCVVGGVAANQAIRNKIVTLAERENLPFYAPPPSLCTDNGVMIAWAGVERFEAGLTSPLDLKARPRWPLAELSQEMEKK